MDEDEDLDCAILEKSNSEFAFACFSFGNFQSDIIPIKSIEHVKPEIRSFIVKIEQIECFTNTFKQEHDSGSALSLSDSTSEIKEELMKSPNASNSSLSTFALESVSSVFVMVPTIKIGEIICSIVSETSQFNAKKFEEFAIDQKLALVCKDLFPIFDQLSFLQSGVFCFRNSNCISKNELCDMDYVLIVETVFDPGGVTEFIFVAWFSVCYYVNLSRNNGTLQEMEAFDSFFVWALDRSCEGDCGSEECVAVLIPVKSPLTSPSLFCLALSSLFAFIYEICIAFGVLELLVLQKRV
jgi:hypothetical protein